MPDNTVFGKLYLIPTTLGDNEPLEVLPISIKRAIENIDYYIVENDENLNLVYISYCLINLLKLRRSPRFWSPAWPEKMSEYYQRLDAPE